MENGTRNGKQFVLGISYNGHNSAACLLSDCRMVGAVEEERFSRVKNDGAFPARAIEWCLDQAHISGGELAGVAVSWDYEKFSSARGESHFARFRQSQILEGIPINLDESEQYARRYDRSKVISLIVNAIGSHEPEIHFLTHHDCHAASAYYCSPYEDALTIVADGSGEEHAVSIYEGTGAQLRVLERTNVPHSLGHYFQAVTELLGLLPNRQEGTVTALAGLGGSNMEMNRLFERCLNVSAGRPTVSFDLIAKKVFGGPRLVGGSAYTDLMAKEVAKLGLRSDGVWRHDREQFQIASNFAHEAQSRLSSALTEIVEFWLNETQAERVCLAGGVALNCRANGRILSELSQGRLKGLYIQPASHDGGGALGAALTLSNRIDRSGLLGLTRFRFASGLHDVRWGPSFSKKTVEETIVHLGLTCCHLGKSWHEVARRIKMGQLAGFFSGACEFGPRALGNRSILASPSSTEMIDKINEIKGREFFRPVAPAMFNSDYLRIPHMSIHQPRFMLCAYNAVETQPPEIPGAFHSDGSWRPQWVSRTEASPFAALLAEYEAQTGVPVLLNTSLNGPNEPICLTPKDALDFFLSSSLDFCVIEGMLVEKA